MAIERINVLGVGISALNLESATRAVLDAVAAGTRGYICVTGAHGVIEAQDDPSLRGILNRAYLCTPDGMPMVRVGRFCYGKADMGRVYGPDLMWEVFRATESTSVRHFFYGGKEGVADQLKEALLRQFPGATIAGTYCPPFRPLNPEEEKDLARRVEESRADILWVGLSTPKQERFMAEYVNRLHAGIMVGVGAAFDFHAGLVPSAPAWMQQCSLEWFYRLTREPSRLWPRYSRIVPRFLFLISRQMLAGKDYPLESLESPSSSAEKPATGREAV